ncbi:MAG: MFS transporter [Corynebacterium sp.]|uniref:MFS transporter n=1 Tax=unclassified Corynebacterium TaxID=2624378 RepID=UPI0009FA06C4|nr:MFS transporter [Corynebacterium sp. CNJ-954]
MVVLAISQVVGTVGVGIAPSIGVLLAEEVTSSETWAGLARTASTLGAAFLGLPLGMLAARFGRRAALASGWWVSAVGAGVLIAAAQWSLTVPMFLGLLFIGAGTATSLQSRFAATDRARPQDQAKALALIVWVGTLGMVLGPNLGVPGGVIGEATGLTVFAGAFAIAAVCLAVAGLLVFVFLRPDPLAGRSEEVRLAGKSGAGLVRTPLRERARGAVDELRYNRPARTAVIAVVTAQVVMVSVMTMTPVHVSHQGGSVEFVGVTISLHILGMYALAPVVGLVTDRIGHRATIGIGIVIFGASLTVGAVSPESPAAVVTSLILLGVGWSFVNVAGSALFSRAVPDENRATAQGGVDALSNLCGAVAAFASGPLMAVTSFRVLCIIAMVVLVPLIIITVARTENKVAPGARSDG